jgi:8-oxo-dGTP pyrophosphatase MutT (NUDIX family)
LSALVFPLQECVEANLWTGSPVRILLLKRTPQRGGFWQPVSGRVEGRDGSFPAAVRREVLEETGFRLAGPLEDLDWSYAFPGRDGRTWRVHAFAAELPGPSPPTLSDEHTEWAWLAPAEALRTLSLPDNRDALRRLLARRSSAGFGRR